MYISELYLKNFLSYKEQLYKFEIGTPILIQGINNNKSGQESNGSGKSGLQSALEYLLLKTTSRKGRDVELIRRGQEEGAFVSCKIVCSMRKQTLSIRRSIPQKGSTTIEIFINDDKQEIANVNDGNDFILNWLHYTSEDLQNYYIINKERYTSFFYSSNSKKLDLISRFANIKLIEGVEDEVDVDIKAIDEVISELTRNKSSLEAKIEECEEQLVEENDRDLKGEREEEIKSIEEQILNLEKENNNYVLGVEHLENDLHDYKQNYTQIKGQFDKLGESIKKAKKIDYTSKISKIKESIEEVEGTVSETEEIKETFTSNIQAINKSISKIDVNLSGSVQCPNCHFDFIPSSDLSVEELEEQRKKHSKEKESASANLKEVDSIIEELKVSIKEYGQELKTLRTKQNEEDSKIELLREDLNNLEEQLSEKQRKINKIQKTIEENSQQAELNDKKVERLKKDIEELKNKKLNNPRIKELKDKIKSYTKESEELQSLISVNNDEAFNIGQWKFNFKKFRSKLAQESLAVIQNKVNEQLKLMKSDIRLKLGGFKMKASGDLKEEITPTIIDNGDEINFGTLSGGERVRVDFATILALQEIINQTHPYGGLDLIWTDEVGEGIDPLGLKLLMKSMPENKTVLVTTHVTIKDMYENILTVENNNGISSIV